jgi:RimJ/RimL family protein N-acetyltransferase
MRVLETERLVLRRLTPDDAPFILELLNEPSFLRFIGDRGVRDLEGAREYIRKGPEDSYRRHGFGLFLAELKQDGAPVGICGLLKREVLEDVDIGFAFSPRYWGKGYAIESAAAVLEYGRSAFCLSRIVAVSNPDNAGSHRVLEKLGMRYERMVQLNENDIEIKLFARDFVQ